VRAIEQHPACAGRKCLLGGVSFGGLLAFEVARQLQNHLDVQSLVLLDTLLPGAKSRNAWATLSFHFNEARKEGLGYLSDRMLRRLGRQEPRGAGEPPRALTNTERLWRAMNGKATKTYLNLRPSYRGDTLIVRAADASQMRVGFDVAPDLGWSRFLTGPVKFVDAPGDHLGILRHRRTAELILEHERELQRS
jgi:thioesterase domain-containing protein